jgi:hypothetical protein
MVDKKTYVKILAEKPEDCIMHWMSCCYNIHGSFIILIALNFSLFALES